MRIVLLLVLGGVMMAFSACYPREIVHTQRALEREMPDARFRREVAVSFGPGSMGLAKWITSKVDDAETQNASSYLEEIDRFQFGVYQTDNLPKLKDIELPSRLQRKLDKEGWELAATAREDDQLAWLLYKENGETVEDLFAVVLVDERLFLARVEGNLNELLEKVAEDHRAIEDLIPGAQ